MTSTAKQAVEESTHRLFFRSTKVEQIANGFRKIAVQLQVPFQPHTDVRDILFRVDEGLRWHHNASGVLVHPDSLKERFSALRALVHQVERTAVDAVSSRVRVSRQWTHPEQYMCPHGISACCLRVETSSWYGSKQTSQELAASR